MTRSAKSETGRTRPGILRPRGAVTAGLIAGALAWLVTACGASPSPAASGSAASSGAEPVPQGVYALPDRKLPQGTRHLFPPGQPAAGRPVAAPGHMPAGSTMAAIAKREYLRVGRAGLVLPAAAPGH
jgi:hypothetical protein